MYSYNILRFIAASIAYLLISCFFGDEVTGQVAEQGKYFYKKTYEPTLLPIFEISKKSLPEPIFDENPELVDLYWETWSIAFKNFHEPTKKNGFVSQYIDASFNESTFQWDDCFMSIFCNYGYPIVPGINSLDNFYVKQHEDGEICRELITESGEDYWDNETKGAFRSKWGYGDGEKDIEVVFSDGRSISTPHLTLDGMNHPLFAWAEWESFLMTGNKDRLSKVYRPLIKYYEALERYLMQGNGLFITDWASMDNSPRNLLLKKGGTGIDISSEMALFSKNLSDILMVLDKRDLAKKYKKKWRRISKTINQLMWDSSSEFYYDLTLNGNLVKIKTIAGFWPLLAEISSKSQASSLIAEIKNQETFGRLNPIPTLAANEERFSSTGGYWQGGVWAPTNTMIIEGLEKYGHEELAQELALKHLNLVAKMFEQTGTIWECYSPDSLSQGFHPDGTPVKRDFVGWSGIAPIHYFIKYAIGLSANSLKNEIKWNLYSNEKVGCKNFRFNGHVISLIASPLNMESEERKKIRIESDGEFTLKIVDGNRTKSAFIISAGIQEFVL